MFSKGNIISFSVLIVLVLAAAGFFMARILPVMREAESMSREFQSMLSQRRDLASRPEGPPSEALLEAARDVRREKEQMFRKMEDEFSIGVPELVPEGITRPSIYWLNTLRAKRAEISSAAEDAGLGIPAGLGFADGLPDDERVPELLFRLYVTEELIGKAVESNLRSISALSFGESGEAEGLGDMGVHRVPLMFSVEASLEDLFLFVKSLQDASFKYIVDDMRFEAVEVERVEVEEVPPELRPDRPPEDIRRREREPDVFRAPRQEETIERRFVERFLNIGIEMTMYYTPEDDDPEIGAADEYAAERERDFSPGELPEEEPREPVERRRIVR